MKPLLKLGKALLVALLVLLLLAGPALAQDAQKPVMQNVFFNVVWGSAFGATLGLAVSVLGSNDKSSPQNVRSSTFSGATAGGLIGLGLALYLVYGGITFDNSASTLGATDRPAPPIARLEDPPFLLVSAPDNPLHITGFKARVLDLRF
jgi:peptidoglycan/LPS O-acetylase OafA/YrhL